MKTYPVYEIDKFMSEWAKPELSENWDNDGVMLCRDISRKTGKVLVCLEINEKVIEDAKNIGAELIITHHPFIFRPLSAVKDTDYKYISELISANIDVLSYHTRLDAAEDGVNDTLAQRLCLLETKPFAVMGRYGFLPQKMTGDKLSGYIKEKLSCGCMRCYIDPEIKEYSKIAVLGGGGKDFIPDAAKIADAYITGDLSHNAFITARELGISVFDAGHYSTENPVIYKIKEKLEKVFPGLSVTTSDSECPFTIK